MTLDQTMFALLLSNDMKPVMDQEGICMLLSITEGTLHNKARAGTMPFPVFKLGSKWCAHLSDIASHINDQRAAAAELLERMAARA